MIYTTMYICINYMYHGTVHCAVRDPLDRSTVPTRMCTRIQYRYWNVVLREMGEGQAGQADPLARLSWYRTKIVTCKNTPTALMGRYVVHLTYSSTALSIMH